MSVSWNTGINFKINLGIKFPDFWLNVYNIL